MILNIFIVLKAPSSVSVLTESDKNDEMSNNGKNFAHNHNVLNFFILITS